MDEDHTVLLAKLVACIVIFLMGLGAGLPTIMMKKTGNQEYLGLANTFAAGVFLAVALCHLLPEAAQEIELQHPDINDRFPIAFILCLLGFVIVLTIERVIFSAHGHGHSHGHGNNHSVMTSLIDTENEGGAVPMSPISGYVLLLALSLHGTTEGMALGLQDEVGVDNPILIAIVAHKWAESMALGIAFSPLPQRQAIGLVTTFSLSTPIGVILGILLSQLLSPIAVSYVMALAAGSFVYIGACEMVSEEFRQGQDNGKRLGCFIVGIVTMVLLKGFTE